MSVCTEMHTEIFEGELIVFGIYLEYFSRKGD